MKQKVKYFVDTIIACPLLLIFFCIGILPVRIANALGRGLARISYTLKLRKKVILKNLAIAFPEKTEAEREIIARQVYFNTGEFIVSWLTLSANKNIISENIRIEGVEHIEAALQQGKGLLLCSAHFGNWEYMASAIAHASWAPLHIIRHKLNNLRLDKWFTDMHEAMNYGDIIKGRSMLEIFRRLKKGEIIGMLVDQSGRGSGVWVPYFNRPSSFHKGAGVILSKLRCPAVTVFCIPEGSSWVLRFQKLEVELTGDMEMDAFRVMSEYARQLQTMITEYPDRYFWFHRRWKTKPPTEIIEKWEKGELS